MKLLPFCLILVFFVKNGGSCTYPSDLEGTWYLSDVGEVLFNSTHMETTHSVAIFGQQTFQCYENIDDVYLSVSSVFPYLNSDFRLAFCWHLQRESSTKYVYYAALDVLPNTTNTRVMFKLNGYSYSIGNDCLNSYTDPWYHRVMVKTGSVDSAEITCPDYLLGYFHYTFTSASGSSCSSTSSLEVCSDTSVLLYDYSQCPTIQAYSAGGRLSCVHDVTSGDNVYMIAYNRDANTDESTYYRYTCFLISKDMNDSTIRHVTQFPQACMANQTSQLFTPPGAYLRLSGNVTCVSGETTTSATSNTEILSAGTLVAITVISIVAMTTIIILSALWLYKKWKATHVSPEVIDKLPKVIDKFDRVGSFVSEASLVSCYSPYPTVSEIAFTRYGPSPIPDYDEGMSLSDSDQDYGYMDQNYAKPVPKDRYHDFPEEKEYNTKHVRNGDCIKRQEENFLYDQPDDSAFLGIQPVRDDKGVFSFRPITRGTEMTGSLSSLSEYEETSPDFPSRLTNVDEESVTGTYPEVPKAVTLPEVDELPLNDRSTSNVKHTVDDPVPEYEQNDEPQQNGVSTYTES